VKSWPWIEGELVLASSWGVAIPSCCLDSPVCLPPCQYLRDASRMCGGRAHDGINSKSEILHAVSKSFSYRHDLPIGRLGIDSILPHHSVYVT
jgi:hypothetical protein